MLCLLALLLTSCAATGPATEQSAPCAPQLVTRTRVVDTGCDWTKPIYVSKTDVLADSTAREILAHNEAGAKNCGWKPAQR